MPKRPDIEQQETAKRLRAVPGAPMAAGSMEPFIGRDEARLLVDFSLERLNSVPVGPPEIIVEDY